MTLATSQQDWASHLLSLSKGYGSTRIFLTALELDLFRLLDEQALTSAEMASGLGADPRATEILLDALVALGLLVKRGDRFVNSKVQGDMLLPDALDSLGGWGHALYLWEAWSHLTETIKTGRPVVGQWTADGRRDMALYMRQHAQGTARTLIRIVDLSDVNHMLDLGGGVGACAIALARQYAHLRIVLLDQDEQALKLAREDIECKGLKDRIELRNGDFFACDLGHDYDLVLLSSIICLFEPEQNLSLLRRAYASLSPGGRIAIVDSLVDPSGTQPVEAALFAVNLLVTSPSGRSYSYDQVVRWLRSVGLENVQRVPLYGSQFVVAARPAGRDVAPGSGPS